MDQIEKDLMWDEMDKHLAYLNGTSEDGESYEFSLRYITEMLNGWNFIEERDTTKYQAVLSNTFRQDKETQLAVNIAAREYLNSTDWYVTRKSEKGTDIPSDILVLRDEARASIVED